MDSPFVWEKKQGRGYWVSKTSSLVAIMLAFVNR